MACDVERTPGAEVRDTEGNVNRPLLKLIASALILGVSVPTARLQSPERASARELEAAVAKVSEGLFDVAVFLLEDLAGNLSQDPSRRRDLARARLYLGVAFVGLGREEAARASFRQALDLDANIRLDVPPDPAAASVFETAARILKAEWVTLQDRAVQRHRGQQSSPATPAPAEKKKSGGNRAIIAVVAGGAAAAGIAVAASGGGKGGGAAVTTPVAATPTTTAPPAPRTESFTGIVGAGDTPYHDNYYVVPVSGNGTLTARANFTILRGAVNQTVQLAIYPGRRDYGNGTGFDYIDNKVASLFSTGNITASAAVSPGEYTIRVYDLTPFGGFQAQFAMDVTHP
jgi:hypothetical protein